MPMGRTYENNASSWSVSRICVKLRSSNPSLFSFFLSFFLSFKQACPVVTTPVSVTLVIDYQTGPIPRGFFSPPTAGFPVEGAVWRREVVAQVILGPERLQPSFYGKVWWAGEANPDWSGQVVWEQTPASGVSCQDSRYPGLSCWSGRTPLPLSPSLSIYTLSHCNKAERVLDGTRAVSTDTTRAPLPPALPRDCAQSQRVRSCKVLAEGDNGLWWSMRPH